MSLADALRLSWTPGLARLRGKPSRPIQAWLTAGTYQVSPGILPKELTLEGVDRTDLLLHLAFDVNRISSAARETLANVTASTQLPRSSAWALIKVYYAALFCAHSILRISGVSPSWLEVADLLRLRRVADLYGVTAAAKFSSGQYCFTIDPQQDRLTLAFEGTKGGSHANLWKKYVTLLEDTKAAVSGSIATSESRAKMLADVTLLLSAASRADSSASWLSTTRNSIQYKQGYGLWFPYQTNAMTASLREKIDAALQGQISINSLNCGAQDVPTAFFDSCLMIIISTRQSIRDMQDRAEGAASFLRYGQTRLELSMAG